MQELHRQARIDTLTGCLSYGVFYDELGIEVDRALRHGHALSLLIVDIDLFKSFNDSRGHGAGDAALVQAGALISGSAGRSTPSPGSAGTSSP